MQPIGTLVHASIARNCVCIKFVYNYVLMLVKQISPEKEHFKGPV